MARNVRSRTAARLKVNTADSDPAIRRTVDRIDPRRRDVLDKTRPYGTVGGVYEIVDDQGKKQRVAYEVRTGRGRPSLLYGIDCERIYRPGERPKAGAAKAPAPPVDPLLEDDEEENEDDGNPVVLAGPDDINLRLWALGEERHRFAQVRDALETRYGRVFMSESEAREFLMEEKIVSFEEMKARGLVADAE